MLFLRASMPSIQSLPGITLMFMVMPRMSLNWACRYWAIGGQDRAVVAALFAEPDLDGREALPFG
jgi:hypothetical protein